jgi:hypothetical protein
MNKKPADLLATYPKVRPPLPPAFQAIYAEHYKENRDGGSKASGLAQKLESWMHRKVSADSYSGARTLEIGAGTLNHLPYEHPDQHYDIVEPFAYLYESSEHLARVQTIYPDIENVPETPPFDRIISIATFEHICELPAVIAKCGLLLAAGGKFRLAVPSEGTILWRLGYTMTTGLEFKRKHGLDYEILMRHEHVNTAAEIEGVLRHFFKNVKCSVFGVARSASLYQFFLCDTPDIAVCRDFVHTQ